MYQHHQPKHPSRSFYLSGIALAFAALLIGASASRAEDDLVQPDPYGGMATTATVPKKQAADDATGGGDKETPKDAPAPMETPAGLLIHGLIQMNFSDHYFTPRGLDVENKGVIVQPLVLLFWGLYHNDASFLDDVTLTTGVWNSVHSVPGGPQHDDWNEIDPIFDISFGFAKNFKAEVDYTIFRSQNGSFPTCQNLELKLDYDDSKLLGPFAIHPYAGVFIELFNKATFANTPESYYWEFGIDPSYTFKLCKSYPLTIEAPSYITFPEHNFYGRSSVVGVVGTGVKLSVPMAFIPASYGHWTYYAAYNFYSMQNPAVIDYGDTSRGANFYAPGGPIAKVNHEESVLSTGFSIFF
jgi:hypothetical protein